MPNTKQPTVSKYRDYAEEAIDEQAILDKYNAATLAQFNAQREQTRQAENAYYNQMYNTQQTAMDTIRNSNAAAVSTGASRGVQAANELSAILGLQNEAVTGATELAQANRETAQQETAAVLENVLKAYQDATRQKEQLISQGIESASVDVQDKANAVQASANASNQANTEQNKRDALQSAAAQSADAYLAELSNQGYDYKTAHSAEGQASLDLALNALTSGENNIAVSTDDWASLWDYATGPAGAGAIQKYGQLDKSVKAICDAYGLDYNRYKQQLADMHPNKRDHGQTKEKATAWWYANYNKLINDIKADYAAKA